MSSLLSVSERGMPCSCSYSAQKDQLNQLACQATAGSLRRKTSNSSLDESLSFTDASFDANRSQRTVPSFKTFSRDVWSPLPHKNAHMNAAPAGLSEPEEHRRCLGVAAKLAVLPPFRSMCDAQGKPSFPDRVAMQVDSLTRTRSWKRSSMNMVSRHARSSDAPDYPLEPGCLQRHASASNYGAALTFAPWLLPLRGCVHMRRG